MLITHGHNYDIFEADYLVMSDTTLIRRKNSDSNKVVGDQGYSALIVLFVVACPDVSTVMPSSL